MKAPPPPRSTRQPQKEKMFLAFRICAGVDFFKMERTFFFLGFCPPSIRAVWRGFNSDSVLRKLFSGDMDFRKTETNLFLILSARRRGLGRNPRGLLLIFLAGGHEGKIEKILKF